MYSVFEEVLHEADLKYIGILLNYGLSVEKIAKDFELDEAYVKEIKSEIDSKNTEQEILFLLFLHFLYSYESLAGNQRRQPLPSYFKFKNSYLHNFLKKYVSYELFICFSAYYMYTKKMEVRINEKPRLLFKIRRR